MEKEPAESNTERKVAIVGGARSRVRAPYRDESWEIWAFSSLRLPTPRITRWFEMHAFEDLQSQLRRETARRWSFHSYMRFLAQLQCPIYLQQPRDDLPTSLAYPLQDALDSFGRCFTSTASYLIALAILEGFETIGVWGVSLTARNVYARQRPGVEYLLGKARERGVTIVLPKGCPLRIPRVPRLPETPILYGYDWESPLAWWRRKLRVRSKRRVRRSKRPRKGT